MHPYIRCFLFKEMSTPFRDTFKKVLLIDFKSSNSEAQLHLQALEPAALDHVGWIGRKEPHLQTLPIMFRCIPHILNA